MKRVRPVLVTSLLAAALLAPAGSAHADDEESPVPPGPALRHGDLVGALVRYASTTTQDGVAVTRTVTEHYDLRGRLVEQDVEDTDPSGAVVSWQRAANEYDAQGRLVHQDRVSDYDADGEEGPYTWSVDTAFDKFGNPVSRVVTLDYDSDGTPEDRSTYAITTDRRSRTTTMTIGQDGDGEGDDDTTHADTVVYDVHGNVLRETSTSADRDGVVYSSDESVWTYDPNGRQTGSTTSSYGPGGALQYRQVQTVTYDKQGRLLESRFDGDQDGDGVVDSHDVNTYLYDQRGRAVSLTVSGPYGGYIETFGYDAQGRLVRDDTVSNYGGEGFTSHRVLSYDTQGRRVSEVTTSDYNGDGTADYAARVETTYDAQGRTATETTSSYEGETMTGRVVKTWAYPTHTGYTLTTANDWNGDGTVDVTTVVTRQVS